MLGDRPLGTRARSHRERARVPDMLPDPHNAGFSLLEMLVVLVLIAILTGTVTLSLSHAGARALTEAAETLQSQLRFASDQAVMEGSEIGLLLTPQGYRFLRYDPRLRRWKTADIPGLGTTKLANNLTLEGLKLDDRPIVLPGSDDPLRPALLFLSSGESTPFALRLMNRAGEGYELDSDGLTPPVLQEAAP